MECGKSDVLQALVQVYGRKCWVFPLKDEDLFTDDVSKEESDRLQEQTLESSCSTCHPKSEQRKYHFDRFLRSNKKSSSENDTIQ